MKKISFVKGITVAAMVALLATMQVWGASVTYNPAAAATNSLFSSSPTNRGGAISQITIANPSATASITVRLLDAPGTNGNAATVGSLIYTNAAGDWTNHVRTSIQFTNIYTDILGNSVTNIYTTITNTVSAAAAATNNYRAIGQWVVPSNTTTTISFDTPTVFGLGLVGTNNGACTITVTYLQF